MFNFIIMFFILGLSACNCSENVPKAKNTNLPGAAMSRNISDKIKNKLNGLPKGYDARTRHFENKNNIKTPKYTNRLIFETSPYLLQHAHNPVNWYSWGDKAFEDAKNQNKPIFLSIGYSTCHWCHVMEEESFEDEQIAEYLNKNYIAVKIDREERPDIDAVYMSAVQAISGSGGWPMSVWLTHDRKPFYGGTYFPPYDDARGTRAGFLTILTAMSEEFQKDPVKIAKSSEQLHKAIKENLESNKKNNLNYQDLKFLDKNILNQAYHFYSSRFDSEHGGMRGRPKFPSSLPNRFLLRYYRTFSNQKSLNMALFTLKKMAEGGMYDQVGGGFHRYSVDEKWLVPHFEKMLYDNALLVPAYLEAYQITKDDFYKNTAVDILNYISRDMLSPEGVFYSATDADSLNLEGHREEGFYFTWTPEELTKTLGEKEANIIIANYGVSHSGNFEHRNILNLISPPKDHIKLSESSRKKLLNARNKRPLPIRDDKILTSWNGLMISAFAQAGLVLNNQKYTQTAERALDFILKNLFKDNKLFRTYKNGQIKFDAYLDDYAFLAAACLDLFESSQKSKYLEWAVRLDKILEDNYEDKRPPNSGGFFMTAHHAEKLLAREKPGYDGAEPAGNSIQALNLMRLNAYTTKDVYRKRAEKLFLSFSDTLTRRPMALSEMLLALDFYLDKPKEIILVSNDKKEADKFKQILNQTFLPNKAFVILENNENLDLVPYSKNKDFKNNQTTAYVCEMGSCKFPTNSPEKFWELIN